MVLAIRLRRYQLHEELGVRRFCGGRVVDRGVLVDDVIATAAERWVLRIEESGFPAISHLARTIKGHCQGRTKRGVFVAPLAGY